MDFRARVCVRVRDENNQQAWKESQRGEEEIEREEHYKKFITYEANEGVMACKAKGLSSNIFPGVGQEKASRETATEKRDDNWFLFPRLIYRGTLPRQPSQSVMN